MIVTDLRFWRDDPEWISNHAELLRQGAIFCEEVDVYQLHELLPRLPIRGEDIGLVVIGGFHPHDMMAAAAEAIAHQLEQLG